MTATKTAEKRQHRWTLAEVRRHDSALRDETEDLEAVQRKVRWARTAALLGWLVAVVLAVFAVYLILFRMPSVVPFLQEEHGLVTRLATTTVSPVGGLHGIAH